MRALVIDDSRAMRRIVSAALEGFGYETRPAGHGQEAHDVLQEGYAPDLCTIDWNMPVMDGLTFIKKCRQNPEYRDVVLMMVTTESEQANIVRALAAGAHEYVIKPFTDEVIAEKLEMLGLIER